MLGRLRWTAAVAALVSASCIVAADVRAAEPRAWAEAHLNELLELYYHFHRHPELSFEEKQTSQRVAKELASLGVDVTSRVGGYGVVGLVKNGDGPTLMLRADMDALPVVEATQLPYASTVRVAGDDGSEVGVMHACGHDVHITNLLGVARYLVEHRDRWSGTLLLVFQPAEERGNGARKMLDDGLFERFPRPDFALALHVDSTLPAGQVGYRAGYTLANVDSVDITLYGRGGHGAYPHTTIDPIVEAARLVLDLQSVVAREIPPLEPAVITVGSIRGGAKHNVIADSCELKLTVRSYKDEIREQLLAAIRRKALATAASSGAPEPKVEVSEGTPAMFNDDDLVERVVPTFRRVLGDALVLPSDPSMGGEDFSFYGRAGVPIFMYRLGSVDAARLERYEQLGVEPPSLHSAVYYPDAPATLTVGITTMAAAALDLLAPAP